MKIGKRTIGKNYPVFIITEIGVNYNNKLSTAFKMIDIAKKSGADAVKFQTYLTDEIQLRSSIKPNYQNKINGKNYYEIIKNLEPSLDQQKKIFLYCKKKKIMFLSTPYDKKSVDFLDKLGVEAFKISSSDMTNHILLEYVAKKKKPILLSTGMSTTKHVDLAFKLLKKLHLGKRLALFHTTSDYPTKNNELNINIIPEFIKKYKIPIGLSDHSPSHIASIGAISLGASLVEKHFTLNRKSKGPDHSSSLEPKELEQWIKNIRILEKSFGTKKKFITNSEKKNLTMRKVLVLKPSKKGVIITKKMLESKRGNLDGILPLNQNIKKILGKKLKHTIKSPTQFSWNLIK